MSNFRADHVKTIKRNNISLIDLENITMKDQQRQRPVKNKTKMDASPAMDYEQTIIPGHTFQGCKKKTSLLLKHYCKTLGIKRNLA